MMAFLNLEDLYGSVEVIVFPNMYERYAHLIKEDGIIVVKGNINFKEDEMPKLIAEHISGADTIELLENKNSENEAKIDEIKSDKIVKLRIQSDFDEKEALWQIKEVVLDHKGTVPVIIYFEESGKKLRTSKELWVEPDERFMSEIHRVLGEGNVKLEQIN